MRLEYLPLIDPEPGSFQFESRGTQPTFRGEASILHDGRLVIREVTISAGRSKSVGVRSSDMRALRLGELRRRIADDLREDSAPLTTAANLPDIKRRAAESPETLTATEQAWLPWIGRATTLGLDLEEASAQAIAQADTRAKSIWTQSPNRGRGARNDDFYREVAITYLSLLHESPNRVIARLTLLLRESKGDSLLSRHTVSTWVRRAREEHWLTKSSQGKAGGTEGRRLEDWVGRQP